MYESEDVNRPARTGGSDSTWDPEWGDTRTSWPGRVPEAKVSPGTDVLVGSLLPPVKDVAVTLVSPEVTVVLPLCPSVT